MTQAQNGILPATGFAGAALAEVRKFTRATMHADHIPADTSSQIADLAALVADLPQALRQLADILERALSNQTLTLDSMAEETDAATAVRVARLHLEGAGCLLVGAQEHLDAAHNATAHLVSDGVQCDRDHLL